MIEATKEMSLSQELLSVCCSKLTFTHGSHLINNLVTETDSAIVTLPVDRELRVSVVVAEVT
jgi:hypothetical protein